MSQYGLPLTGVLHMPDADGAKAYSIDCGMRKRHSGNNGA